MIAKPGNRLRRRRFLCDLASLGLSACAPGQPLRHGSADSRVLYLRAADLKDPAASRCEKLGTVDDGAWVACPDDAVKALAEQHPPAFLYFRNWEYQAGIAGLSLAQIEEVIRRRRDQWAPRAKSFLQPALFDGERAELEGSLRSGSRADTEPVELAFRLLQRMAGLERYRSVPAKAMATTVLEGEALLLAEVKSAVEKDDAVITPGDRSLLSVHRGHRQVWAAQAARAAVALGATEFENTLPFEDPSRVVFVRPADAGFENRLAAGEKDSVSWRDGLVFAIPERHVAELRRQNRTVDVLYADSGEFYDSLEMLTAAQLRRDFAERLGRTPEVVRQDTLGHIDRLHLHQILMKRELRARPDASKECHNAGFDTMIRDEIALLGNALTRTRTFSRGREMDRLAPALVFQAAGKAVAADLRLFRDLAPNCWPGAAPILLELQNLHDPLLRGQTPLKR